MIEELNKLPRDTATGAPRARRRRRSPRSVVGQQDAPFVE
jgi:hypothetical protein